MKEGDKYPSFYSVPVFSTDSLSLVQLQILSEDFSAMVNVSNNSSGLIVTALNDIFFLSFPKHTRIYKIYSNISFISRFGWLAYLDYKFFRAKTVSYTMCTLPETGTQQMKQADGSGIVLLEHLADFLEQHHIQMVN